MNFQATHAPLPSGKPTSSLPARFAVLPTVALGVCSLFLLPQAHAATRYWDGGTIDIAANGDGTSDGANGTWSTGIANWDQGSGLAHVDWVNGSDVAVIDGTSQTLTLGTDITLGGIIQKSGGSFVAIGGGSFKLILNITGANTFQGAANDTTGRTLTVNAVIAGAAGKNLVIAGPAESGTGTINLGSSNTFSGTTSFSAGATGGARVVLNTRLALQNSTVTLSSKANVVFSSTVSTDTFTFGGLAASSAGTGSNLVLRNNDATPGPIALTVGGNNSSTTYKGVLSGTGSLIKTGSGTLTLGAANTYTGATTVSNGTLQVDGSTTSATTVANGATLAGGGLVNAAVTVSAGGSLRVPDNNLTVSSLTYSGTGTLHVGTLSSYTSTAALTVTNALALSGGAATVTLNLPTAPGFNGTFRLIQFGSGPANTNGFKLGTVPTLAWNQTATLQVSGNYLNYVITSAGDTTPPTLASTLPANNAADVLANANLVATFDETIVAGTGNIELRRTSDGTLVESYDLPSSPRLAFSTARLIINPTADLPVGQYYLLIPAGAVKDTSGNNYAGITLNTGWKFTVTVPPVTFTDTGSPANPLWSEILPTLNVQSADPGPVFGSLINVNNPVVEVGLYGNRPISVPGQRIHVACNTSTNTFSNFTRWFQTDGNTHMLRIFVDDENTATSRVGTSSHTEAFNSGGWEYADNMTHEWTGHYTGAQIKQGSTSFQLMNSDNEWAFHLSLGPEGTVNINNRNGSDALVTNPDGSAKVFGSSGFDVRVLDDGLNYRVFVDGVLYTSSSYSRPTGTTNFRWGMYFGANNLNPPADYNIIMVSGAQIKSWPGRLTDATTTITKANNTTTLNTGSSWVGNLTPGIHQQALWNSTVLGANTTTLAAYQQWAGLKIVDPGGPVTINGTSMLGIDDAGVDMSTAMKDLTVNCPVQMTTASTWNFATDRTATFGGVISGFPNLTKNGGGTLQLNGANTYGGDTLLNAGTLVANNNSALSGGLLVCNGGNLSSIASRTLGNDVDLKLNAAISVSPAQTLTLNGSISGTGTLTKDDLGALTLSGTNTYTGPTIVSAGTLAVGNTSALLTTPSLTLADGTQLQPNLDGVVMAAPITVGASGTTATISAPTNAPGGGIVSTLTLKSVMAGSGNVSFSSSANQNALSTVYLGAQNTYAGSTLLTTTATTAPNVAANQQIIVKLGINNALPPTTVMTIDGGTGAGSGRFAEFNLNGFNQQLAGLTNIPRSFTSPGGARLQRVVNSDISAAATLTINNSSEHTFSGNLGSDTANGSVTATAMPGSTHGNNFGLTKNGAGTFILAGANSYSGGTTVGDGRLISQAFNTALGAAAVSVAAPAILQLNNNIGGTTTLAFANAVTGAGTLEFSGTNTVSASVLNRTSVGSLSGFTGGVSVLAKGNYGYFTANNTINQNLSIAADGYMTMSQNGGFGRLNGGGTIFRNGGTNSTVTLTLGNNNATGGVFSGSIRGESILAGSGLFASSGLTALTKVGTGIQTLSGANTYAGPTTIIGGTLALGANDALANSTDVSIGTATLDAATFTNAVGTLAISGNAVIQLGTGAAVAFADSRTIAWTSTLNLTGTFNPGSSLRFGTSNSGLTPDQLALIAATGVTSFALNADGYLIPAPVADYASWKTANAPSGTAVDDFDSDGVSNAIEYVLGGTAATDDMGDLPTSSIIDGNLVFTFKRVQASIDGSTTLAIELGSGLGAWPNSYPVSDTAVAANPGVTVLKGSPPGYDTITLRLPQGEDPQKFARLKVTVAP